MLRKVTTMYALIGTTGDEVGYRVGDVDIVGANEILGESDGVNSGDMVGNSGAIWSESTVNSTLSGAFVGRDVVGRGVVG